VGGGYPDALLLATPPYGSLNEREIGTTFGMRAQDAIAWNPRRFRFLNSVSDMEHVKASFQVLLKDKSGLDVTVMSKAGAELLKQLDRASAGRFEVVEARLTAGVGDPPAFAEQWAMHLSRVPHTLVPSDGTQSARGELRWIRFKTALWLPKQWVAAPGLKTKLVKCAQ
jgi:hypothetical protein